MPPTLDWMKHIWSIKTSPKLKDFLWKVANKAIPVSRNLERRGCPAFRCKKCGGEEDDLHTFLLCPLAKTVWDLAPLLERPEESLTSIDTLISLVNKSITLPPVGLYVPLWPWILWQLWKARNNLFFDNRSITGEEVLHKAIKDAKEWQDAQTEGVTTKQQTPNQSTRSATPLQLSGTICHVDAAWKQETKTCGIGGVFTGAYIPSPPIISYSRRFISSALIAEALAVRSAVMMAASSNIQSLTVLSDSQVLILLLKAKDSRPALHGIMSDIYHLSRLFKTLSFYFIPRLENREADHVAKLALLSATELPMGE
ncbi:uncharacterized protein LOC130502211 [Raphanus sativus]|uniref:Uncharacterized protein LOC130502211 n=1 Tax=Raphanus sativus TaxID=3726 RepID=A0A9W3CND4_RAPSA|nr:uncharacterized protein LOC130502211 [Raphanus sativus]